MEQYILEVAVGFGFLVVIYLGYTFLKNNREVENTIDTLVNFLYYGAVQDESTLEKYREQAIKYKIKSYLLWMRLKNF
jgi:hypothetical protein